MNSSLQDLLAIAGIGNVLFLAFNTFIMVKVDSTVQALRTDIERYRREDADAMREEITRQIQTHTRECTSYMRRQT